ncbi:MAG: response regulator [Woeseiaceae bacterium]|nr:response regulator [Woeseiaceae bacterium]
MITVLVVDDNDLVRNLIEAILSDAGCEVLTASSGPGAVDIVSRNGDSIDCVIQDLSMPKMPGEQVISELNKLRPGLPVIVLSVDDAAYSAPRLAGLSIAAYVQKPFDSDVLVAKVRGVALKHEVTK